MVIFCMKTALRMFESEAAGVTCEWKREVCYADAGICYVWLLWAAGTCAAQKGKAPTTMVSRSSELVR